MPYCGPAQWQTKSQILFKKIAQRAHDLYTMTLGRIGAETWSKINEQQVLKTCGIMYRYSNFAFVLPMKIWKTDLKIMIL